MFAFAEYNSHEVVLRLFGNAIPIFVPFGKFRKMIIPFYYEIS